MAGVENGENDRNRSTTYKVSLNAKEEVHPVVRRCNQQNKLAKQQADKQLEINRKHVATPRRPGLARSTHLYESDDVTWIQQKNELPRGQLVADLDAPNETQAGEQELAAEPFPQLEIGVVVANAPLPRIEYFADESIGNDEHGLERQMGLAEKVDAILATIAVEAKIDT